MGVDNNSSAMNNSLSPTKHRRRSSTLNQVIRTPKQNLYEVKKTTSPTQLKPIKTTIAVRSENSLQQGVNKDTVFLPPEKEEKNPLSSASSNNNDNINNNTKVERKKKEDCGNKKKQKKMNSNQLQFVKSLNKRKPKSPIATEKEHVPTYKKKAPAPLLTFNLIKPIDSKR